MTRFRNLSLVTLLGMATAALAQAPTPAPAPANGAASNPSAASSPSQRDVVDSSAREAPATDSASGPSAASTPHQREALGGAPSASGNAQKVGGSQGSGTAGKMPAEAGSATAFVQKAGQDGMTEVALAKLALSKSSDEGVRSFAQRMVKDHGAADAELSQLARRNGIDAPGKLDAEHQAMVQALSAKSGAGFDATYADDMAKDHAKAVALFEHMAQSGDGDFAAFAQKTLPTLREHKEMADRLQADTRTAAAEEDAAHRE
jgi:putative membrane protein